MAANSATTVVGADACPAGWLVTTVDDGTVTVDAYGQFKQVRDSHTDADRILVDIPIGLPSDGRRRCDALAKDLLGCRGGSVFYAPSESAIQYEDYEDAKEEHEEDIGHGLIMQAHNLRDKILEVQDVAGDDYDGQVRESHPELCFAALNGQPIAYAKSSEAGRELRLQLLEDEIDEARVLYRDTKAQYLREEVRRDDILDSMCLAVAAREDQSVTTPPDPDATEPRIYYPDFEFASQMRNA
jgi:predicted RNase H-like nuclease